MNKPATLSKALEMRARKAVIPYAGGTDLMVEHAPGADYLFLADLEELKEFYTDSQGLHIGPALTYAKLLEVDCPKLLKESIRRIASPALRNAGTIGGNICNASPAGDTLPVLLLFDTKLVLASSSARRTVLLDDFIMSRKQVDLASDELLVDIILSEKKYTNIYYHKIGSRRSMTISKIALAAASQIEDDKILDIGIAYASLYKTPLRFRDYEKGLINLSREQLKHELPGIIGWYATQLKPISDARSTAEYRHGVALSLLEDFLNKIIEGANDA